MVDRERSDAASAGRSGANVPLDVLPLYLTNLLTVLDEEGIILYESPSIEHIYGFEPADLIGEPVAEYFHPDDREAVLAAFQSAVAVDEVVEAVEYRHRQADGSYCWVESVASANPTPAGNYVAEDGPGIPEDERERVFDAGVSNSHEGTGLGLTMVEEIAQAHGWDVDVTEVTTGGARFEFRTDE